ncbi:MAG: hypothetical protein M1817_004709 [Caeruleum heppii]|nr:MAG: hypothetical protein M1817_004709 [Caeruleum heppii]
MAETLCCCHCITVPAVSVIVSENGVNYKSAPEAIDLAYEHMCPFFKAKFLVYGYIGSGTFGMVMAGRDRRPADAPYDWQPRHYAIKIVTTQNYPFQTAVVGRRPNDGAYYHSDDFEANIEAYKLFFLRGAPRLSQIHSAYPHGPFVYIVMDVFGINITPAMHAAPELLRWLSHEIRRDSRIRYRSNPGTVVVSTVGRPKLGEAACCKVSSHLLEALMSLIDRRMCHKDMSHRNYLVDGYLNAQLIDFESLQLCLRDEDFECPYLWVNYLNENLIAPEVVVGLLELYRDPENKRHTKSFCENVGTRKVKITGDHRALQLWKLGGMIFELLHGFATWTDLNYLGTPLEYEPTVDDERWGEEMNRNERRQRMLTEPLPIKAGLSQDCVDVLQAMMEKRVEARPSVEELLTFPWFQGWYAESGERLRWP